MRWRLALALALAFLATGIYGAYAYVHNYSVYRGFPPPSDPHGVPAGRYVVSVRDRSKTDSFHLSGPGVNRKTGRTFQGLVSWTVTLKAAGTYRYWSDARPSLAGTIKAR